MKSMVLFGNDTWNKLQACPPELNDDEQRSFFFLRVHYFVALTGTGKVFLSCLIFLFHFHYHFRYCYLFIVSSSLDQCNNDYILRIDLHHDLIVFVVHSNRSVRWTIVTRALEWQVNCSNERRKSINYEIIHQKKEQGGKQNQNQHQNQKKS